MHQPRFLTIDDVLLWHRLAIYEIGGSQGVRDRSLLESAIAQPRATFGGKWLHTYPAMKAAAYAFHLAKNHPFLDGNKRVAWAAMRGFLHREGYTIEASSEESVKTMGDVATGKMEKPAFAEWVIAHWTPRSRLELRDFLEGLSTQELIDRLVAVAASYRSGGAGELTAVVDDVARSIPAVGDLARMYVDDRANNAQAIHYIQLFAALHGIATDQGYAW